MEKEKKRIKNTSIILSNNYVVMPNTRSRLMAAILKMMAIFKIQANVLFNCHVPCFWQRNTMYTRAKDITKSAMSKTLQNDK